MLDQVVFQSSLRGLAFRDEDLARVIETYGAPALWVREPGFPSLVNIILEQQVSLASARGISPITCRGNPAHSSAVSKTLRPATQTDRLQPPENSLHPSARGVARHEVPRSQ
jgi:hypothetical protein